MSFRIDPTLPPPKTNSEYDKLCEAYEKGRKAKEAGQSIITCPFKANKGISQSERDSWIRGWLSGNRKK